MKQRADAFELDVRLTRDGAPVVIHDDTLDRTTDLTGPVRARTLAELRGADAGWRFTPDGGRTYPFRGAGVRIPTLAEVFWTFPAMPVMIEVKEPEVQEAVRRVLVEGGATRSLRRGVGAPGRARGFPRGALRVRRVGARDLRASIARAILAPAPGASRYRLLSVPLRWHGLPVPTRPFVRAARGSAARCTSGPSTTPPPPGACGRGGWRGS